MIIVRPIEPGDREAYERFAFSAELGIINLPKNPKLLDKKIQNSLNSFQKEVAKPGDEEYVFVLEDLKTGEVGGTCAIAAKTGVHQPTYFYRLETVYLHSSRPEASKEMRILSPVTYTNGPSEICALYLQPHFRQEGLGKLLSLSRFLFIASNPNRFENTIMAEMRGLIDKNDFSPFWEHLGRKFFDIEFIDLMRLQENGREFAADILPRWPIYVSLLPSAAQDVIGKTHIHTKPALNMLNKEGFRFTGDVDIFDGGPIVQAKTEEIRSITFSYVVQVESITHEEIEDGDIQIISCLRNDFRACYSKIKSRGNDQIAISRQTADALRVKEGDAVRYAAPSFQTMPLQSHN